MRSNNIPVLGVIICVRPIDTKYIGCYALRTKFCKFSFENNNMGEGHRESMM
jgi:hypothetical protein